MCGIVGSLAYGDFDDKKDEKIRQEAIIFLTSELLQLTMSRGKDATGIATLFADGDFMGLKMGVSAAEFITRFGGKESDYDGYLSIWRKKVAPAKIIIGHCRKPSTGVGASAEDNTNNHPIKIGDIVGIHNGTLNNHEKIFTNLKCSRDSKVDSEAIFRLLDHLTRNGEDPFTTDLLQETCKRLSGQYAVLAFNGNNPFQLAAFRDGRPMEFALLKPLKLLLIASERDFLKVAITRYNKMSYLYQTGASRFTPLRKDDVEFASTIDESIYLFDLTRGIEADTKIASLYDTEKIPRTGKIWGKNSTTGGGYNYASGFHGNNNAAGGAAVGAAGVGAAAGKKTEVGARKPPAANNCRAGQSNTTEGKSTTQTHTKTGSTETENRIGMAWNKNALKFEPVSDIDGSKKHGCVEMNCESGSVVDAFSREVIMKSEKKANQSTSNGWRAADDGNKRQGAAPSGGEFNLVESNARLDDLIADPAKIKIWPLNTQRGHSHGVVSPRVNANLNVQGGGKPDREVDLAVDAEVFEKAVEATRVSPKFSSDEELSNALEIVNLDTMYAMKKYSLANRIKSMFYHKAWYAGYMACKAENQTNALPPMVGDMARMFLERAKGQKRRASATIRALKVLVQMLAAVLEQLNQDFVEKKIEGVVANGVKGGAEINPAVLEKAIKQGDLNKMPAVKKTIETMRYLTNSEE